jgi:two-component system, chemotaxis family, chemotaxis protein CheY
MAIDTRRFTFVPYTPPLQAVGRERGSDSGTGRTRLASPPESVVPPSSDPESGVDAESDIVTAPSVTERTSADVLVVDDDADVRWTVAEILRSAGFSVAEAEDGDVALGLLNTEHYRMVLLDMRMPNRDGVSLIEAAGDVPPVIVHSAYSLDAADRERLGSRVVEYLHKPVSPQKLLRAIETVLGSAP